MRIAVVYHLANPGGITRFAHALIDGLVQIEPGLEVDYYVSETLLERAEFRESFLTPGVRMIGISDPSVSDSNLDDPVDRPSAGRALVRQSSAALSRWPALHDAVQQAYRSSRDLIGHVTGRRFGKHWYQFALSTSVVSDLASYDVVYLPFPYYLQPAHIRAPLVGTFHDFNHLYFPANFGRSLVRQIDRQLRFWTQRCDATVVSTHFVEQDLLKHYPGSIGKTSIVFVAPYNRMPTTEQSRRATLTRFGLVDEAYVIYPSNHSHHKNLVGLLMAAGKIKEREGTLRYPVVFTGFGTDALGSGKWPSFAEADAYLAKSNLIVGADVRGLGFVTDEEVDALTQSARAVVSTSLYEAGCGPALDAWQFGVPVAFSDIPPFVEQLDALGVEALVFDPKNPDDIARVIWSALTDREAALAMAARSRVAITGHTWERAAAAYLGIFRDAIRHYRSHGGHP